MRLVTINVSTEMSIIQQIIQSFIYIIAFYILIDKKS